ncbi:hypothetical protein [Nitratireductor sp. ZSWI3]|uniref:hypothetical protein n=1 Tax=Nitratireductor sp. ZSWI3 TaxID=2966359 RepID=UPI00214FE423|nr:hypothetical protein [Nitratireductor sp. ZSWI3]MCR4265509.1 hypothetical protein [Nitratireductor sp. ZSWI3]
MTPRAARERVRPHAGVEEIVDADFETVAEGGGNPVWRNTGRHGRPAGLSGMNMLQAGGLLSRRAPRRGGPFFWSFGALLVLAAFWVAGGHSLVHDLPLLDASRPMPAMKLVDLQSRVERHGDRLLLIVDGAALNDGSAPAIVPGLAIDVLADNGSTTRYFLGTNELQLEPGTRFPFSSRLVAPSEGVKSVSVTFRSL